MTRRTLGLLGVLCLAIGAPRPVSAQEAPSADRWQFVVAPYLLFPHMEGTIGLGPVSVDVESTPSDVFSNLQFGGMLAAEAKRGPWAIGLNGMYMDLGKELETITGPGGVQLDGELGAYQGVFELTGFRALTPYARGPRGRSHQLHRRRRRPGRDAGQSQPGLRRVVVRSVHRASVDGTQHRQVDRHRARRRRGIRDRVGLRLAGARPSGLPRLEAHRGRRGVLGKWHGLRIGGWRQPASPTT